jgi:Fe2+ transport system protein B
MDESDREENELLLAPATKAKQAMNKINAAGVSIVRNRIYLILLLVALVTFGTVAERQIMTLQTQLDDTELQVEALQVLTEQHEKVIERFSESITNEDVLKRLGILEQNMTDTESYLKSALRKNEDLIKTRLDEESKELQDQVDAAEAEIHNKVSQVEEDIRTYYIETKAQFSMENSFMVYQLAGTFTLLSCLISMWHMTAHLRKLNQPMVQRKILAILWMSPVYAITSWFSLVFPKAEGYLAIIKDGYEAYIIFQFLSFCIAVIGKGDRSKVVDILATHADHLTPPFRLTAICELCGFCKPPPHEDKRQLADEILLQCQFVRVSW